MFLQNHWYVVAWDYEIGGAPFARTICGEQVVVYRRPDRSLVALEDCCPHRLLPLSKGRVEGDNLVCGYHGITFDCAGKGVWVPGGETIPDWVKVRTYPVVERYRYVWVWIGDAALADESKLPNLYFCEDHGWAFDGGSYHVKADYRLMVDNLMDLTHETYVHPTSIGQHEITEAAIETTSDDETVTVSRWMNEIIPPPFWAHNLKSDEPCDRWQICRFTLPANVMIDVGVALAGTGAREGDRSKGITGIVVDLMTPETETSHWYYWGMARDFEVEDQGLSARIRTAQGAVFAEDLAVLEAQQANIEAMPGKYLANFKFDDGSRLARRMIDRAHKNAKMAA